LLTRKKQDVQRITLIYLSDVKKRLSKWTLQASLQQFCKHFFANYTNIYSLKKTRKFGTDYLAKLVESLHSASRLTCLLSCYTPWAG
jgi:hypothetical protein